MSQLMIIILLFILISKFSKLIHNNDLIKSIQLKKYTLDERVSIQNLLPGGGGGRGGGG